jgi:hypothetical protein
MSKSSKDLLSFLFLESAEADAAELNIEENLEQLFEAAAEAEEGELQPKKTPLAKALSQFGISDADLVLDPEGFSLTTDNRQRYEDALTVLGTPEAMHKLAEMGWVVTKPGDPAMGNEPAQYRIRFLEITTVDANDREPKGGTYDTANREEVIKKAQEFATTPMDRDDELSPVEAEKAKADDEEPDRNNVPFGYGVKSGGYDRKNKKPDGLAKDKHKGVGEPKDGEDPKKAIHDAMSTGDVDKLVEMTTTGSMGTVDAGPQFIAADGVVKKAKPYSKGGTRFYTPRQWKVKQPVVNKMTSKHSQTEALGANKAECHLVDPACAEQTSEAHCPHEMNAEEFLKEPLPGEEPPKLE